MHRIWRTWMDQGAGRTTAAWSLPDLPFQDPASGKLRQLPLSLVLPQVSQTILLITFSILLQAEVSTQCGEYVRIHIYTRGKNAIFDVIFAKVTRSRKRESGIFLKAFA